MRKQLGQSMTEFLVVMPVMLLLILGAIQFIIIYQTKTTLNYATFEAVRAGTLENASREAVENGFTRGLAPLFARFKTTLDEEDGSGSYTNLAQKVTDARRLARDEIADGYVKIELLHPTPRMFRAFGGTIPNDNLGFRPNINGFSPQDANLLKIRITYCMRLIVPMVNGIISAIPSTDVSTNSIVRSCYDPNEFRYPIVSTALMRMQSDVKRCRGCYDNN